MIVVIYVGALTLAYGVWIFWRMFRLDYGQFRALKIYFFYGKKGSGKSLFSALLVDALFNEYARTAKKYPGLPKRKVYVSTSLKLSPELDKKHLHKDLEYWGSTGELYEIRNADIIWDEIGKDFPAGSWAETPKRLKQVFSHLRKRGNRLFANTQLYEDVDVSFRRQVDYAYKIEKVFGSPDVSATMPGSKKVWGLVKIRRFDPMILEHVREEFNRIPLTGLPFLFFIRKKLIAMYDTTLETPPFESGGLEHIELTCKVCKKPHITHRRI